MRRWSRRDGGRPWGVDLDSPADPAREEFHEWSSEIHDNPTEIFFVLLAAAVSKFPT
jgi:hypothetical protein